MMTGSAVAVLVVGGGGGTLVVTIGIMGPWMPLVPCTF